MKAVIDWFLGREAFRMRVRCMIDDAAFQHDVVPLPVEHDLTALIVLTAQINCDHCQAPCCKPGVRPEECVLSLNEQEFQKLGHRWNTAFAKREKIYDMPLPCPLLDESNKCTVYEDRPLVCIFYPLDTGTSNGTVASAVQSSCPEARRIAENVYMAAYDVRKKARELAGGIKK